MNCLSMIYAQCARGALSIAEHVSLPGDSHFFITFRTDAKGVCINQNLVKEDENDLTIVIQHQYWDLKVEEDSFSVTLSFSGKPEALLFPLRLLRNSLTHQLASAAIWHSRRD